jgi:hypothetical protein
MSNKERMRKLNKIRAIEKEEARASEKEWEEQQAADAQVLPILREVFKEFSEDIPENQRSPDERICKCYAVFPASQMVHHKYGPDKDACPRCGYVESFGDVQKIDDWWLTYVFWSGYTFDDCRRWGYLGVPLPELPKKEETQQEKQERFDRRKRRLMKEFLQGRITEDDLPPSLLREIKKL